MLSYAAVERLLAQVYFQSAEQQAGAFRARLKNLKRGGIPLEQSPGRGKRIQYTLEHVYQMAFCLECIQLGFDPSTAVVVAKTEWDTINEKIFRVAERRLDAGERDMFAALTPEFISRWNAGEDEIGRYSLRPCPYESVMKEIDRTQGRFLMHTRRRSFINITALIQRIKQVMGGIKQ